MTNFIIDFKVFFSYLLESLYLQNFYKKILTSFKGRGLVFLLYASLISSFVQIIFLVIKLNFLYNYQIDAQGNINNKNLSNLDHIFNQIPDIKWDGSKISFAEEETTLVRNLNGKPIIYLGSARSKITSSNNSFIYLMPTKIGFNVGDSNSIFYVDYTDLFNISPGTYNKYDIKDLFFKMLYRSSFSVIAIMLPLPTIFKFFSGLLFQIPSIIFTAYYIKKLNSQGIIEATRLIMFSSGVPLIFSSIPIPSNIIYFLSMWTFMLAIYSVRRT